MHHTRALIVGGLLILAAGVAHADMPKGISWRHENVDKAFAEARAAHKPLFLYWGAAWCPPCNQVKATLFNQPAFKERAAGFIPVYLDGDLPGAQKAGARFKVRGYPTMIVFSADGSEITRLPGEADPERYLAALGRALTKAHPLGKSLKAALAGEPLPSDEWQALADYPWEVDEAQQLDPGQLTATLAKLASVVPAQNAAAPRLRLRALAATAQSGARGAISAGEGCESLRQTLQDRKQTLANLDLLNGYAKELTAYCQAPVPAEGSSPAALWEQALAPLCDEKDLSANDRLQTMATRLLVAKGASSPVLPPALVEEARRRVAAADAAIRDRIERQSVIPTAADVLLEAELLDDARKLLQAELGRSLAPYYHMLGLAAIAKKQEDNPGALRWYERAYRESRGSATRLQWGVTYVSNLIALAPEDEGRVSRATRQLIGELGKTDSAFYDRNRRSVERLAAKLAAWNRDGARPAATDLLQRLAGVCTRIPAADPQKEACRQAVKPPPS